MYSALCVAHEHVLHVQLDHAPAVTLPAVKPPLPLPPGVEPPWGRPPRPAEVRRPPLRLPADADTCEAVSKACQIDCVPCLHITASCDVKLHTCVHIAGMGVDAASKPSPNTAQGTLAHRRRGLRPRRHRPCPCHEIAPGPGRPPRCLCSQMRRLQHTEPDT